MDISSWLRLFFCHAFAWLGNHAVLIGVGGVAWLWLTAALTWLLLVTLFVLFVFAILRGVLVALLVLLVRLFVALVAILTVFGISTLDRLHQTQILAGLSPFSELDSC